MADEPKTYTEDEVNALLAEREKGLKTNRDEALKEAKAAKAKLAAYDGFDPEEYKALKAAAAEAERKKATAEGDFKALEKQLVDRHQAELGAKDTKLTKLQKALEKRLVDAELTRAIAAHKGEPDLLLPYARQFVRVREVDDDYEGYIADERGNPMIADGKGTPMDFSQFVAETLMKKFPRAFEGTGSSGGGAAKSSGGGAAGIKTIANGDGMSFLAEVENIAAGKTTVG